MRLGEVVGLPGCRARIAHLVRRDTTRLRDAGVAFLSAPVEFRPGVWIAYFRGPDGETCELRET